MNPDKLDDTTELPNDLPKGDESVSAQDRLEQLERTPDERLTRLGQILITQLFPFGIPSNLSSTIQNILRVPDNFRLDEEDVKILSENPSQVLESGVFSEAGKNTFITILWKNVEPIAAPRPNDIVSSQSLEAGLSQVLKAWGVWSYLDQFLYNYIYQTLQSLAIQRNQRVYAEQDKDTQNSPDTGTAGSSSRQDVDEDGLTPAFAVPVVGAGTDAIAQALGQTAQNIVPIIPGQNPNADQRSEQARERRANQPRTNPNQYNDRESQNQQGQQLQPQNQTKPVQSGPKSNEPETPQLNSGQQQVAQIPEKAGSLQNQEQAQEEQTQQGQQQEELSQPQASNEPKQLKPGSQSQETVQDNTSLQDYSNEEDNDNKDDNKNQRRFRQKRGNPKENEQKPGESNSRAKAENEPVKSTNEPKQLKSGEKPVSQPSTNGPKSLKQLGQKPKLNLGETGKTLPEGFVKPPLGGVSAAESGAAALGEGAAIGAEGATALGAAGAAGAEVAGLAGAGGAAAAAGGAGAGLAAGGAAAAGEAAVGLGGGVAVAAATAGEFLLPLMVIFIIAVVIFTIIFGALGYFTYCMPEGKDLRDKNIEPSILSVEKKVGLSNDQGIVDSFVNGEKSTLRQFWEENVCPPSPDCGQSASASGDGSKDNGVGAGKIPCLAAARTGDLGNYLWRALARAISQAESSGQYNRGSEVQGFTQYCYGRYQWCLFPESAGAWGEARTVIPTLPSRPQAATNEQQDLAFVAAFKKLSRAYGIRDADAQLVQAETNESALRDMLTKMCLQWEVGCRTGQSKYPQQDAVVKYFYTVLPEEKAGKCGTTASLLPGASDADILAALGADGLSVKSLVGPVPVEAASTLDLKTIAQNTKSQAQSIVVQDVSSGKIQSVNGNAAPDSPASTIKLIVADVVGKSSLKPDSIIQVPSNVVADTDGKVGQISVSSAVTDMLQKSGNTSTNALVLALGGPEKFTQLAKQAGYSSTSFVNYLSIPGQTISTGNTSTAIDITKAMNNVYFVGKGGIYDLSRQALGNPSQDDKFSYSDQLANKIGANSLVIGNSGVVDVNGKKYIVTTFTEKSGIVADRSNDAYVTYTTQQIIDQLKNGATLDPNATDASIATTTQVVNPCPDGSGGSLSNDGTATNPGGFVRPAPGVFTACYGMGQGGGVSCVFHDAGHFHKGIDIANDSGTPIVASKDGTVSYSACDDSGYGCNITLNHGNATTLYGHMSKLIAKAGQKVKQGDVIGLMGTTGFSTGNHTHFEISINGQPVDPCKQFKCPGIEGTFK